MGACKTAVLLIGVAVLFHLVPSISSHPVPSLPKTVSFAHPSLLPHLPIKSPPMLPGKAVMSKQEKEAEGQRESVEEEDQEAQKTEPPMSPFEKMILSTEMARQKAALASALIQEYKNRERVIDSKYIQFSKKAEDKKNSADEYADWSKQLEEASLELMTEAQDRLNLAERVDKHADDYARLSRRSEKEAREEAVNATVLESKARSSKTEAMDLFTRAKLKHERAEDFIECAQEEDKIAVELQRKAVELSKLAQRHRGKASNIADRAQQMENSAYEDELSAVKHEKEAKILERMAEIAMANDHEKSLLTTEYLIRQKDKQSKAKRLRVGARYMHVLAEVYNSEASTLLGIAQRDEKEREFYKMKASQSAGHHKVYRKTVHELLGVFKKYMREFRQNLKKCNQIAAKNGYEYIVMKAPVSPDVD